MSKTKEFLARKDIEFSVKRYVLDAFSAMAFGFFGSLLIGLIIKTIGEQSLAAFGDNQISAFLINIGGVAMTIMGPAIGVAVAYALKAPPLVLYASAVVGWFGAMAWTDGGVAGGPAGAFIAVIVAVEFGKLVSKETKLDIIITPGVTVLVGAIVARLIGPLIGALMTGLGNIIVTATDMQPFWMGIIVSVIVGLVLTSPLSSAALCMMLGISGLAAGAATVGGCTQMVGFAIISIRVNGIGGIFGLGIGTAKLMLTNAIKKPVILIPPTLASAVLGPVSTVLFKMTNIAAAAGMGTCCFVGQIGTFTDMGFTLDVLWKVVLLHIVLTGLLSWLFYLPMRKWGVIKDEYMKLPM